MSFGGVKIMGEGSRCGGERRSGRFSFAVFVRTGRQGIKGSADERVEAAVAVAVAVTGVHGKQVDGRSRDPARPANDFHF